VNGKKGQVKARINEGKWRLIAPVERRKSA